MSFERDLDMEPAEIRVLLDRLAHHFEDAEQDAQEGHGWGQFLDDPKEHVQVGPYGTSAGLIVTALAGRQPDVLETRIGAVPASWWTSWKAGDEGGLRLLCQNPRLAFFSLGLRVSGMFKTTRVTEEVENELLARMDSSGLWGNYWISRELSDRTPRLFCSAIVVLCLMLLRENPEAMRTRLLTTAEMLEDRLLGSGDLPVLHTAAVCAALLCVKGKTVGRKAKGVMRRLAWSMRASLGDLGVYFYDFQYPATGPRHFGRDYFIVPTEVIVGVAGLQPDAPVALRLRAERTASLVAANLKSNDGFYRPDSEQRVSSKNQAWIALFLHLIALRHPIRGNLADRAWYWLRRERRGNWFTEVALPLIMLALISIEIVVFKDLGSVVTIITAFGGMIISGIYQQVVRGLFRGR